MDNAIQATARLMLAKPDDPERVLQMAGLVAARMGDHQLQKALADATTRIENDPELRERVREMISMIRGLLSAAA